MYRRYKNLEADPKASLIVFALDAEQDRLGSARVTLMGELHRVVDDTVVRERYLARRPQAAQWVDFGDFALPDGSARPHLREYPGHLSSD